MREDESYIGVTIRYDRQITYKAKVTEGYGSQSLEAKYCDKHESGVAGAWRIKLIK